MATPKHFTKGVITGRITEIKDEVSANNKKYVTMQVDVSSTLSGDVTAYCRMYDKEGSIDELKRLWNRAKSGLFKLQAVYSQYQKDASSPYLSSFTLYSFELVDSGSKRAYFIVVGEVTSQPSALNCGGQRFLVTVTKPGNNGADQVDEFEFWAPGEKLLSNVAKGQLVRAKGLVRQKEPDGICGGDGPIRAYLESLDIHQSVEDPADSNDIPY